jgi:signal transduction histidine kinase
LREIVHGVMPAALIEGGLVAAITDLTDRLPLRVDLDIAQTMTADKHRLPGAIENTVYLVIAEALTNVIKHSQATAIQVSLDRDDDSLHLAVIDNGVGGASTGSGLGLRGIADRIDNLGGRLAVISPPGAGTRIEVDLPCES